ncbi:MAG: hypothetical protein ACHREM_04790 [Polyangiales bacterium]
MSKTASYVNNPSLVPVVPTSRGRFCCACKSVIRHPIYADTTLARDKSQRPGDEQDWNREHWYDDDHHGTPFFCIEAVLARTAKLEGRVAELEERLDQPPVSR